ncbi:MAG: UDP-N-acetylmuramate dehydrogenase [Treponema sp.]|jgi:UDP-N-acetylmuramate dehydrogenase|nr:UDP-N-acetylmuramate dehydrogenase [Treponema sp.]
MKALPEKPAVQPNGLELKFNMRSNIVKIINQCMELFPCEAEICYDDFMSEHTTFNVGGPADCRICPQGENFPSFSSSLIRMARNEGIPVFILGGGANIVVSDKGIRGIVLDTCAWKGAAVNDNTVSFHSGTSMDEAVEFAANQGLGGLEFLAGMPGSIGGAVYMNARCYGSEIADVLAWTQIIDFSAVEPQEKRVTADKTSFGYKHSPFQGKDNLIISATFSLKAVDLNEIKSTIEKNRRDRQEKGHYRFPCAGSAFKNNHEFGKPTGQIIDELGLKGFQIGGAQIAPFHGNIVINTGSAASADIRALMDEVSAKVKTATGFTLEPEILFVGQE